MNSIVTVSNLKKSYQSKKAVDKISFTVNKGEILGFLGPNGAGKSTTINILSTILKPDSGEIEIFGHDLRKDGKAIKKMIGVVPQDLAIYEEISAEENVRFFTGLYGFSGEKLEKCVKEALELVGLYDRKGDKPKTFSGGMKRRLNIACAIAHQPKLIIMDEPTVGIDPQSRNHILESIKKLQKRGATLIYSTHYMEEVEAICDQIIIMDEGKIIAEGTKEELNQKVDDQITYTLYADNLKNCKEEFFKEIDGVTKVKISEKMIEIKSHNGKNNLSEIIAVLIDNGCKIDSMSTKESSLESVFLELTGKKLRD